VAASATAGDAGGAGWRATHWRSAVTGRAASICATGDTPDASPGLILRRGGAALRGAAVLSVRCLERLIEDWHDRSLMPGSDWSEGIDERLLNADIVLLLVSADFLASDACFREMEIALRRQQQGECAVIAVIVRESDWRHAPFAHLQALPTDAQPVSSFADRDRAWQLVIDGIREAVTISDTRRRRRRSSTMRPEDRATALLHWPARVARSVW
jgi:hypothetical protein